MLVGVHVSKRLPAWHRTATPSNRSIIEALEDDLDELGLDIAQIFTHGPQSYKPSNMDYAEVRKFCRERNIELVVHSSYLTAAAWTKANMEWHVRKQIDACAALGALGLVVHLSKLNPEETAARMRKFTRHNPNVRILLEIEPRKPTFGYATPAQVNELCCALRDSGIPNRAWGICVDTAHLWASGVDVSHADDMRKWLHELQHPEKIELVHLNGCSTPFGSGSDTHAIPWCSTDKLFGHLPPHDTGAAVLYKWCRQRRVPIILEINAGSKKDVDTCLDILRNL